MAEEGGENCLILACSKNMKGGGWFMAMRPAGNCVAALSDGAKHFFFADNQPLVLSKAAAMHPQYHFRLLLWALTLVARNMTPPRIKAPRAI